jgi:hypothetical protein
LEIDDDLIAAAKEVAREKGETLGQVISELARQSLEAKMPVKVRNGAILFTPNPGSSKTNLRTVNKLRDEA